MSAQRAACDAGLAGLRAACAADFEGGVPCASSDLLAARGAPAVAEWALITPGALQLAVRDDGNRYAMDPAGVVAAPDAFTCRGWTGGVESHLQVGPGGQLRVAAVAGPTPVLCCASDPAPVRVVGASQAVVSCQQGLGALQTACTALDEQSTPCRSRDLIRSPVGVPVDAPHLVRPELVAFAVRSDGAQTALDASGLAARPSDFTCNGWSGPAGSHLSVGPGEQFRLGPVEPEGLPVLCCVAP